jgi:23S rRNA pseudouridine1911/1915/1917 synthase
MKLIYQGESLRIDKYLPNVLGKSRSHIQKLIDLGLISINGNTVSASYKALEGDVIEVQEETKEELNLKSEDIPLTILYEDEDLAVIDKPKGIVVHPSLGHSSGTIVNAIKFHFDKLANDSSEFRPGIVHRLDKDTSGVLIICKTDKGMQSIQEQLQSKECKRTYLVLVHGQVPFDTFKVDAPIGRHITNRQKMDVVRQGKASVTNFKVLKRYSDCSLLQCDLETGRTHQIRVHLQYAKYFVVGDAVYGKNKDDTSLGQYLHAKKITFRLPKNDKIISIESRIPDYFQEMLNHLEKYGTLKGGNE